jgi:predicted GNAT family acetyltransferase
VEGNLVSAGGTHIVAPTYGIAAVGNVFTLPPYRGRGYATTCTSAVVRELLGRSLEVVLNVARSNQRAVRIYERLGFREHGPFVEALGVKR